MKNIKKAINHLQDEVQAIQNKTKEDPDYKFKDILDHILELIYDVQLAVQYKDFIELTEIEK